MAFDILDNARLNISRTENTKLLCQCHYLASPEQYSNSREAFCPSDSSGLSKFDLNETKEKHKRDFFF